MKIDKRYNRLETQIDHVYITTYGNSPNMEYSYLGKVKCKLLHSKDDSIVFPDLIFIDNNGSEFKWIQPLTFLVNLLLEDGDVIHCSFYVDISVGNTLKIEFTNKDLVCNYKDNSSLFNCKIFGPNNLTHYATGNGIFIENVPYIRLFHHTLPRFKDLILKSQNLKLSEWNIQGTKKLLNIGYFYLTSIDQIKVDNDLIQIAMSSNGKIRLLLDNYPQPKFLSSDAREIKRQGILELMVYREDTKNRRATLDFLVDCTILAPKHLWKHYPAGKPVFYEICMPFICRVGAKKGTMLTFSNKIISNQENVKIFGYQVVGLGTTFTGLEAPYNEENTEHIFKIEKLDRRTNILEFWFQNANSDLFTNNEIEEAEF